MSFEIDSDELDGLGLLFAADSFGGGEAWRACTACAFPYLATIAGDPSETAICPTCQTPAFGSGQVAFELSYIVDVARTDPEPEGASDEWRLPAIPGVYSFFAPLPGEPVGLPMPVAVAAERIEINA